MAGGLRKEGVIQGQGTAHRAVPDQALPVQPDQFGGIQGRLHGWIYGFDSADTGGMGILDSQEAGGFHCILKDMFFCLKIGSDGHGRIGQNDETVDGADKKKTDMRKQGPVSDASFLIQDGLEYQGGADQALHQGAGLALANYSDGQAAGFPVIPFIDNVKGCSVDVQSLADLPNEILIADKNGVCDPHPGRLADGEQDILVVGCCNHDALTPERLHPLTHGSE